MPALPPAHEMERAYRHSNPAYDGIFYLGVRTTGVFCRPSCGARKPLPRNVVYFATPREALFAGYRPCRRCLPLSAVGEQPAWIDRLLEEIERNPEKRITDEDIRSLAIDPARVRRFFRKNHGMTFHAYSRGRRMGKALEQIRRGAPLDDVALGYGYGSHSGFRDAFSRTFGKPPGKARGTDVVTVTWIESPLGPLLAAATTEKIVLLEFTERRMLDAQFAAIRRHFKRPIVPGDNEVLRTLRKELGLYFAGKSKTFTVPLDSPGSPFQESVWRELRKIPYGRTISYEKLAEKIGSPGAQRAVGHSNGLNRIAILIPCHRVINKDGGLGGYGGGLWRKQALLEIEKGERFYGQSPDIAGGRRQSGHPSGSGRR